MDNLLIMDHAKVSAMMKPTFNQSLFFWKNFVLKYNCIFRLNLMEKTIKLESLQNLSSKAFIEIHELAKSMEVRNANLEGLILMLP